jgi:hypothetical protein
VVSFSESAIGRRTAAFIYNLFEPRPYDGFMTTNDMRDRARDCYRRAQVAMRAASLVPEHDWLVRISEQWAHVGQQYDAAAAWTISTRVNALDETKNGELQPTIIDAAV